MRAARCRTCALTGPGRGGGARRHPLSLSCASRRVGKRTARVGRMIATRPGRVEAASKGGSVPNVDLILGADPGRKRAVRTEPTQRRSTQRLDALLDAAAEIVDETGFERLTTADGGRARRRVDRHRVPVLPRPRRRAARAPRAVDPPLPRALSPTTSSAPSSRPGGTSSTSRSTRSPPVPRRARLHASCTPVDARPPTATSSPSSRTAWRGSSRPSST